MANTKKYVSLDKLGLYDEKIKGVISSGDTAALDAAKLYADGLASNYDASGAAATAEANAKSYTDTEVAKANAAAAAAQTAADNAAAAAATADGKAVAAQGEVDALETYVGTIPATATATDIVGYIQEKTAGIATDAALEELTGRVAQAETDIDNIEKDYLKAADKTELSGAIGLVQTAVDTEKARAEGIESGLRTDVDEIKGDYLKTADKTELQKNIDEVSGAVTLLANGVDAETIDGVNDLIAYVNEHGAEVLTMQGDIAKNAEDIAGVAGRMTTAEGKITAVEGAVATKVEQTAYDAKIAELAGADTSLGNRIAVIEGKFGDGEGNVESQIEAAKTAAITSATTTAAADATSKANAAEAAAKGYTDTEIDKVEATIATLTESVGTKAAQSEVNTIAGKVSTLEGDMAQAKTDIDAVEAKAAANEGAIATLNANIGTKASQTDLDGVSGRVTTLETWHTNFTEVSEEEINALFA